MILRDINAMKLQSTAVIAAENTLTLSKARAEADAMKV